MSSVIFRKAFQNATTTTTTTTTTTAAKKRRINLSV
jgi:hypothetical protein